MIAEAALGLALIVFPPPSHTDPFTPDATWSIDSSTSFFPIHEPWLKDPTEYLYTTTGVGSESYPLDDDLQADQLFLAPTNPEWDTIYAMRVGIQVEDLDILRRYNQPPNYGTTELTIHQVIKNLRDTFQALNASYKRDLNVDLRISHIRFYHGAFPHGPAPSENVNIRIYWRDNIYPRLPLGDLPNGILRISETFQGGIAEFSNCSIESVATAEYRFEFWAAQTTHNQRYSGHELGHTLFRLAHTQCYDTDPDPNIFEPIEKCGGSSYGCWTGAPECPICSEMGLMGYCGECCDPLEHIRMGPYHGLFASRARSNIIALSQCKPDKIYPIGSPSTIDPLIDTDHDEIPNYMDNCKAYSNNWQRDFDMDGKGDACDYGCQLSPSTSTLSTFFWFLFIIILLLIKTLERR